MPPLRISTAERSLQSDNTQSYEVGAKNNFDNRFRIASSVYYIKWNGIQQNVYDVGPTGGCSFQYTSNLGTAAAKGFDLQAEADLWGGLSIESTVGYTNARYTKDSPLVTTGDAISGDAAINYARARARPGRRLRTAVRFFAWECRSVRSRRLGLRQPQ